MTGIGQYNVVVDIFPSQLKNAEDDDEKMNLLDELALMCNVNGPAITRLLPDLVNAVAAELRVGACAGVVTSAVQALLRLDSLTPSGTALPNACDIIVQLMSIGDFVTDVSVVTTAKLAARSIIRRSSGGVLFSEEQYSAKLHAWLLYTIRNFFAITEEERKVAALCLDRMQRVPSRTVSPTAASAGGSPPQSPQPNPALPSSLLKELVEAITNVMLPAYKNDPSSWREGKCAEIVQAEEFVKRVMPHLPSVLCGGGSPTASSNVRHIAQNQMVNDEGENDDILMQQDEEDDEEIWALKQAWTPSESFVGGTRRTTPTQNFQRPVTPPTGMSSKRQFATPPAPAAPNLMPNEKLVDRPHSVISMASDVAALIADPSHVPQCLSHFLLQHHDGVATATGSAMILPIVDVTRLLEQYKSVREEAAATISQQLEKARLSNVALANRIVQQEKRNARSRQAQMSLTKYVEGLVRRGATAESETSATSSPQVAASSRSGVLDEVGGEAGELIVQLQRRVLELEAELNRRVETDRGSGSLEHVAAQSSNDGGRESEEVAAQLDNTASYLDENMRLLQQAGTPHLSKQSRGPSHDLL